MANPPAAPPQEYFPSSPNSCQFMFRHRMAVTRRCPTVAIALRGIPGLSPVAWGRLALGNVC
jgi:hypothetical protein